MINSEDGVKIRYLINKLLVSDRMAQRANENNNVVEYQLWIESFVDAATKLERIGVAEIPGVAIHRIYLNKINVEKQV